jgi:glycosyltransferase involved in cell wall biosynthesis
MRRPTIVLLNRFYWPDVAATGQMLADLAESLAADGWDVRVITSRGRYASGERLARSEIHAGVRITRVPGTAFGRTRMLGRLADYATYLLGALAAVVRVPRRSIIVGMTDPPLIATVAVLGAKLRGGRAIYWVQDVFPEIAVELETLRRGGVIHRLLDAVASVVYRGCERVVALGPAMRDKLVAAGVSPQRVVVIHNWADASDVVPIAPESNPFVQEHGLGDRSVVLYSGNAGRAHTFDALTEAMRRLRHRPDVAFLFIGGGYSTPELKAAAKRLDIANAIFMDYVPRNDLAKSLSAATISVVTENPRVVGLLLPSKTYGILASGRPILFVGHETSDVAAIVRETGAGEVVAPDDPAALTEAILRLCEQPDLRNSMGARARRAAENRYGRVHSCELWGNLLREVSASAAQ